MRLIVAAGVVVLLIVGFLGTALSENEGVINLGVDSVLAKLPDADFKAYYYPSTRTFDIGIRTREGNSLKSRDFTHDEADVFLKRLSKKDLIVMTFHKNLLKPSEEKQVARDLRDYLFGVGFKRVAILGASAVTTILHLDETASAGRLKTETELKSSAFSFYHQYRQLKRLTKQPYHVSPTFFTDCRVKMPILGISDKRTKRAVDSLIGTSIKRADKTTNFTSGRLKNCAECHVDARGTDYVFNVWKIAAKYGDDSSQYPVKKGVRTPWSIQSLSEGYDTLEMGSSFMRKPVKVELDDDGGEGDK
ncbi:MAG: hypothetical protein L3J39_09260 [Verrucomicrobiales bacterium]|nr:hypothetical protein [Verrucomicrobiales bacterium]